MAYFILRLRTPRPQQLLKHYNQIRGCSSVCVCVSMCVHTHTHTHTHIYIYIYMCTQRYIHKYIYIYTHTHTHIYIFIYLFIYTYTHTHKRTHTHMYIYIYTHTHTYILVHTIAELSVPLSLDSLKAPKYQSPSNRATTKARQPIESPLLRCSLLYSLYPYSTPCFNAYSSSCLNPKPQPCGALPAVRECECRNPSHS